MAFDLKLFAKTVRVLDGAFGTELQKRGLAGGACPEPWNVDNPSPVEAVGRSYVEAGSDVILTNTFGGNSFIMASHSAEDRVAELCEAGVRIARRAAGEQAKVFASIGPTGKIVMMQETPGEQIEMAFAQAATAISHGRPDAIVLETFNELDELEIALRAVKETTNLPVIACMTFSSGPDGTNSMMGNTPGDLARMAEELGADAVGANCGAGPDNYVKVARLLRAATTLPVWIKANAGLPQIGPDGETFFPLAPAGFAEFTPQLIEAGANFIGGCCGTTPEHIRALRAAVDAL